MLKDRSSFAVEMCLEFNERVSLECKCVWSSMSVSHWNVNVLGVQ